MIAPYPPAAPTFHEADESHPLIGFALDAHAMQVAITAAPGKTTLIFVARNLRPLLSDVMQFDSMTAAVDMMAAWELNDPTRRGWCSLYDEQGYLISSDFIAGFAVHSAQHHAHLADACLSLAARKNGQA